jgi:hypothetical protein
MRHQAPRQAVLKNNLLTTSTKHDILSKLLFKRFESSRPLKTEQSFDE